LLTFWHAVCFRLFSRCWAQGCGRLAALHTPRRWDRCLDTPLGIGLTARGWLRAQGLDDDAIDAWCRTNGIDPGAIVQPVAPVSVHAHTA